MQRYRFPAPPRGAIAGSPVAGNAGALYPSTLETQFPRILQAIQALWGYPEMNLYFHKLTIDDRGDRAGFPPAAWEEILLLMHVHQRIVPAMPT